MKLLTALKRVSIGLLTAAVLIGSVPTASFAAEETETESTEAATAAEGEETSEEGASSGTVTPSNIATNIDGKYIALTFPDSEVPSGFTTTTVDYNGSQVELAQMTAKSSTLGAEGLTVTLAYLTDADGSNGEFYVCDTANNAKMSDMIKINGINGHYIIVLSPGDNVVGPDGFTKKDLKWGSKSATAWSLPPEVSTDDDSSEESSEGSETASAFKLTETVYAADDILSAGVENSDTSSTAATETEGEAATAATTAAGSTELDESAQEAAMLALDELSHTNASGFIEAQPDEFCLLYAIDDQTNLGFYLYDIKNETYQRYIDINHGETDTTKKYRKLSRTRLFIIIVLVAIIVIMLFVLINMLVGRRGDDGYEEEEELPKKRKRPAKRVRDYEEDEEEERPIRRKKAAPKKRVAEDDEEPVKPRKKKTVRRTEDDVPMERNRAESEVDWENMEITAGIPVKKVNKAAAAAKKSKARNVDMDEDERPVRRKTRKRQDYDFDEDFDFEFLDIKK
ncbi:MAG: hypothetical protein K6F39_03400 [Lachnospiraceae bacterium]|nr:hypothetical protein [Lachnospiraceae bacterium]